MGNIFDTSSKCIKNDNINLISKECPKGCSNNGTCVFNDVNTGTVISNCSILSPLCTANCNCYSNRIGYDCSDTLHNFIESQNHRNYIMSEMLVVLAANVSNEIILTTMSLALTVLELNDKSAFSSNSISLSREIIIKSLDLAIQHDVSSNQIIAYNDIISNFIGISTSKNTDDGVKNNIQSIYESYMSTLSTIFLSNSSANSKGVSISSPNMQITITNVQPFNSISSLSSGPPHELSIASDDITNSSRRLFDRNLPLVMSVTRASMYITTEPNNSNITSTNTSSNLPYYKLVSNPLYLRLDCSMMNDTTFRLVLQNYANQSFFDHVAPITESFTTYCTANNQTMFRYNCDYHDGSTYTISVPCDGNGNNTYITKCPLRMRKPICHVISSIGSCELMEYKTNQFICHCQICSSSDYYHARRLDTTSFALQVAGAFDFLYDDYISKMTESDKLTGNSNNTNVILFYYAYL